MVTVALRKERKVNYKNQIFNMDCIAGMTLLPDGCVDMVLTDLPYGMTDCRWDSIIPFELLWKQLERVTKPDGAMVFTASQPFTTKLIGSNQKNFRYCWYWVKNMVTGFPFAKFQPLRCVEDIVVFYRKKPTYNPQGLVATEKTIHTKPRAVKDDCVYDQKTLNKEYETKYTNWPRQILTFSCQREGLHPTQKPVALFEYLVRTYTNQKQLVLDCCIGSGTTAIACRNSDRDFVGFEIDKAHFETALERLKR